MLLNQDGVPSVKDTLIYYVKKYPQQFLKLPKTEQMLYDFYVVKAFNQKSIAAMLNRTQGCISSRLYKIIRRFEFIEAINRYDLKNLDDSLKPFFSAIEIAILKTLLHTTCQTETAKYLNSLLKTNLNQIKVRHSFEKSLIKLREKNHPYYGLFLLVKNNLYMLHEVKLPHKVYSVKTPKLEEGKKCC